VKLGILVGKPAVQGNAPSCHANNTTSEVTTLRRYRNMNIIIIIIIIIIITIEWAAVAVAEILSCGCEMKWHVKWNHWNDINNVSKLLR